MNTRQSLSGLNGEPILRPNERGVRATADQLIDDRNASMPPGLCGRPVLGCSLPGPRPVAGLTVAWETPGRTRQDQRAAKGSHSQLPSGPATNPRVHPRRHHRGFRRDHEDQHLRPVLDHQSGVAAFEARLRHHWNGFGASLRSVAGFVRLCADESGDHELREVACHAARPQGDSRQRGCARTDLDPAAGFRWRNAASNRNPN
jgi:hypothetical protein